jgi:hypothetical protein
MNEHLAQRSNAEDRSYTGLDRASNTEDAVPHNLANILEKIGLNTDSWLQRFSYYSKNHFSVLGAIDNSDYLRLDILKIVDNRLTHKKYGYSLEQ